jgi:AAA+ ATPase superfamily predicted ATPase
MNLKQLTSLELIQRAANGWKAGSADYAQELVSRWRTSLSAGGQSVQIDENTIHFDLDLTGIRLHGIENVACLMLAGDGTGAGKAIWDFWHRVSSPDRLVFLLSLSDLAHLQTRNTLPDVRCLRLRPTEIAAVLNSAAPRLLLKEFILRQFPRRQLIPFNITLPVNNNMFFGRQHELDRLCYESETSFAIAGPGRLGKTSLGLQFHRRLVREHDRRVSRKFRIDFYDCLDKTSDGVAKFLAMKIEASSRSFNLTTSDLIKFLKYQAYKNDGPLELLLDEVDDVCKTEVFKLLTVAARQNVCRLVLCGRGNLLKTVLNEGSPIKGRVELIRLKPLGEEPARKLILEPLTDLGFIINDRDALLKRVFHWTGCLPHLLQYYGKYLAALAIEDGAEAIGPELVAKIRQSFETAQVFAEPIESLADVQTRAIAIYVLQDGRRFFTTSQVQEIAARHGIRIEPARALDICNDLVINNIFAWLEDAYSIANHSIIHYARKRWEHNGYSQFDLTPAHLPA